MEFELTSPAFVRAATRKNGETAPILCHVPVTVDLREVSREEAPVVLTAAGYLPWRWMGGDFFTPAGKVSVYGSERGRHLFSEHSGFEHQALASIAATLVDPDSGRWSGASGMRPTGSAAYLQLALWSRFSGRQLDDFVHSSLTGGQPELPAVSGLSGVNEADVERWTEEARGRASRMIVIDGVLWKAVPEPMLELRSGSLGLATRITGAAFDGRHAAPQPYGKLNMRAYRAFNLYWWPSVEYRDMNDVGGFSSRIQEETANAGANRDRIEEAERLAGSIEVRNPEVFGHGVAALSVDRAARVAVAWAIDAMGSTGGSSPLRSAVPRGFRAVIENILELTRSTDPADGLTTELVAEMETLAAVMRNDADALDTLAGGRAAHHASLVRSIDDALAKWDADRVIIDTVGAPSPRA